MNPALICGTSPVRHPLPALAMGLALLAGSAPSLQAQPMPTASQAVPAPQVLVLPDGRRYTGELRNGQMHGRGVIEWPEGGAWRNEKRYEGDFFEGAMHGRGVMTFRNGNHYEGDFAQNRFWGKGTLVFLGGSRYEGDFVAGDMSGRGVYSFYFNLAPTGQRLEGEFIKGELNGQGRELHDRGVPQEGGFLDGVRAGPWVRVHNKERTQLDKGDYIKGKLEGPGEVRSGKAPPSLGFWRRDGFTPLALWPRGLPLPDRSPEALQVEEEVKRRSALAQQHHRDAQAMHLATAAVRQQMARAALGLPAATVAAAPARPAVTAPMATPVTTPATAPVTAPATAAVAVAPSAHSAVAQAAAPSLAASQTAASPLPAAAPGLAAPMVAGLDPRLQGLIDQLDKMDSMDLQADLDRARRCTDAKDFDCAESSLKKAARYANGAGDKARLQQQQRALVTARAEHAQRLRELAEEEERLARRERQLQEEAERQARSNDTPSMSTAQTIALFGAVVNQALQNQLAIKQAESLQAARNAQVHAQVAASVARQQQDFARERADIEARRRALQAQPVRPAAAPAIPPAPPPRPVVVAAPAPVPAAAPAPVAAPFRVATSMPALSQQAAGATPQKPAPQVEPAVCVSYGHQLQPNQSVCYANSMEQYACTTWRGKTGLSRVQKLILKSSLNDKDLCHHVDRTNDKPVLESLLEY